MSQTAPRYITVPVQVIPFNPTCASPPEGGGAIRQAQAGASLVQYNSITDTPLPSKVAVQALEKLFALPDDDWRHAYDRVCYDFVQYLERSEQKGFMVKGYDTRKGKMVNIPMEYDNRWGYSRRMELKEKLERLEYWFEMQEDRPVTMITLTCYHQGETITSAWQKLNDSRTKLLKLIRKYFGDVDYFWVPEPHKSGYVHYHLAVFADVSNNAKDNQGKGVEDKFRQLWSKKYQTGSHTYGLDFSQKKNDAKIQHLKNYLSKYLAKGFALGEWSIGLLLFNAHLWETGFRMYGASKRIREMMNINDEKDNGIVWLETKMQTTESTPEGELIEIEKVIWYRQYIPDWLDSPFWIQDHSPKLRLYQPEPLYIYDWGRPTVRTGHDPTAGQVTKVELTERQKRKIQEDGYL